MFHHSSESMFDIGSSISPVTRTFKLRSPSEYYKKSMYLVALVGVYYEVYWTNYEIVILDASKKIVYECTPVLPYHDHEIKDYVNIPKNLLLVISGKSEKFSSVKVFD